METLTEKLRDAGRDMAEQRHKNLMLEAAAEIVELQAVIKTKGYTSQPVPLRLNCPTCGALHIDEGEFATKPHHTHSCQSCGMTWRPAVVPTVGVQFLPGFKNNA